MTVQETFKESNKNRVKILWREISTTVKKDIELSCRYTAYSNQKIKL